MSRIVHLFEVDARAMEGFSGESSGPSVCLLIFDSVENADVPYIVNKMLNCGCVFFMSAGRAASDLEDRVDEEIEDKHNLDVVTTSHADEAFDEIVEFMFFAALPLEREINCYIVHAEESESVPGILFAARNLLSKSD